jgi:hypothetical protein
MFNYTMWATQNNQSVNMPGVVSDGRLFTNYNADSIVTELTKQMNGLKSNEEYRRFLVQNTEAIMKQNYNQMAQENRTSYAHEQFDYGHPHLYNSIQEDTKPHGYEDTEVKQMYLSRQQLDDKKRRLMKDDY